MSIRPICGRSTKSIIRLISNSHRSQSTNPNAEPVQTSFNKTFADDCVHVTSVNTENAERSILKLELLNAKGRSRSRNEFRLPKAAIEGLKNALVQCSRLPKQLQHEADQLNEVLSQRRFPATSDEVRQARNKIRNSLKEAEGLDIDEDLFSQKIKNAKEDYIKRQVERSLRKSRYNWRPLQFDSKEQAAVYSLARLAANYAEVRSVLSNFEGSDFVPRTVLDYGSGCGGAFWAAHDLWGDQVEEFHLVEPNDQISRFCMDILRGADDGTNRGAFIHPNVNFRRFITPSPSNKYDLIIAHRLFVELASHQSRMDLINTLWNRANKFLVLIDSNLDDSFKALMEARDFILIAGSEIHADEMRRLIDEMSLENADAIETVLNDRSLSSFERFTLLREMVPSEIQLPTRVPTGFVYAPCPHDQGCPKLSSKHKRSCSFPTRWCEIRADGRPGKRLDGTATGSFSYVIMQKGVRQPTQSSAPRLLDIQRSHHHSTCTVCTSFNGLQQFVISKRAGPLYKKLKSKKSGELLPISLKSVATESQFDLYDEAVKDFQQDTNTSSTFSS